MHGDILAGLGLSKNEAKIYETLLSLGESTVSDISTRSRIHRRNIYDAMSRLTEKGLVFLVVGKKEKVYQPVEPYKLLELVQEKKKQLEQVLPDLVSEYRKNSTLEAAYIYKGIEGFKNYLRDMLSTKEDAYFIGAKGAWFDPRLQSFLEGFLIDAKKRGITYHHLFDSEVKKQAPQVLTAVGKPYKFFPATYSTPSMVDIFGDHVVSFTGAGITRISDDITIFVNISRPLATSYKTWFQYMWDMCPDV